VKEMVKNCLGRKPGPDYDDAFNFIEKINDFFVGAQDAFGSWTSDLLPGQGKVDPGCSTERPVWNAAKKACVERELCPGTKVNRGCSCEKPKWDKEKQRCVA